MSRNLISQIDENYNLQTNTYNSLFEQYERVIVQSLITSFGLDFLVRDQHGGDVDTLHNVDQIGKDEQMKWKNKKNEEAYNNRCPYDSKKFHDDNPNYRETRERYSKQAEERTLKDGYTDEELGKGEFDTEHIVSGKELHDSPSVSLSGVPANEIANSDKNLTATNKHTNRSKGSKSMSEYIEKNRDKLTEKEIQKMLEQDKRARAEIERIKNIAYYLGYYKDKDGKVKWNFSFHKDTALAAGKVGIAMGARQALGLVFTEVWFAIMDEIRKGKDSIEEFLKGIADGIKKGFEKAKRKYKEIWDKFIQGAIAGALSSLTTTLCNIFFTTAKNIVKIIRESWASLVEAAKILFFNPDNLPCGERFRAAAKILAAGASVVIGSMFGNWVANLGIGAIPIVGDIIPTFCTTLVTGLMTCSLLYFLDRSEIVKYAVDLLNKIPTAADISAYYRKYAQKLDEYCAKLMDIDLERFQKETQLYNEAIPALEKCRDEMELNRALHSLYEKAKIPSPYGNHKDWHSFMADPNSRLVFK